MQEVVRQSAPPNARKLAESGFENRGLPMVTQPITFRLDV